MSVGWKSEPLRDLCHFHNGLWTGKKGPLERAHVIRNTNFTADGRIDLSDVAVLQVEAKQLAKRRLRRGDIIIEKSGGGPKQPVGRVVLFEIDAEDYSFSNFTSVIRVKHPKALDAEYLHRVLYWWYVSGLTEPMQRRSTGIRNLDFDAYKSLEVPLPPLDEQKRIVAVLDQAFAALGRARANAEANLASAHDAYRLAVNALLELDDSRGVDTCLGDICTIRAGAGFPEAEQGAAAGAYPFYKVSDMNRKGNEEYLATANNYISEAVQKRLGAFVFPAGTIVFPKVGGAIATNKKRVLSAESCVDNNIMGLIPDTDKVMPEYLHELLRTIDIYEFSNKANPPSITQTTVSQWPVRIPARRQQGQLVDRIRRLRSDVDNLKGLYASQLADMGALRQSLLEVAFSGQLS